MHWQEPSRDHLSRPMERFGNPELIYLKRPSGEEPVFSVWK